MSRLARWFTAIGGVLVLMLASHCGDDVKVEPSTQITARIYVDPSVRARLATLHVTSASQPRVNGPWQQIETQSYPVDALPAPVDVLFVPKPGTKRDKQIEIVVEARDAANQAIAQERALVRFLPTQQRLLELWLGSCGQQPVCERNFNCRGPSCQACVGGQCGNVRTYGDTSLPALDPNVVPDANKPRPSGGGGSAVTCADANTTIVCDDKNKCNGLETCDPARPGAMANGCAVITDPISCEQGSTCDSQVGECASCTTRSDGDGDGQASTACGGRDCDDSDAKKAPGIAEACDGKDNDCDGMVDNAVAANAACQAQAADGVTATCVEGACRETMQVTVRFRATVGTAAFTCGDAFSLGMPARDVTPRDFRFFVQELNLIKADGEAVPVAFAERAPFQTRQVALLDFSGEGCVGDAATNVTITGTAPAGVYTGVELVNGVPDMPMNATSAPLNAEGVTRMGGAYRFVLAAVRGAAAAPTDAGAPGDAGVADAGAPGDAGAGTGAITSAVYLTERNRVRITGFNLATDTIRANFARVFEGVDTQAGTTCEAQSACALGYAALGVPAPGPMQSVFTKD